MGREDLGGCHPELRARDLAGVVNWFRFRDQEALTARFFVASASFRMTIVGWGGTDDGTSHPSTTSEGLECYPELYALDRGCSRHGFGGDAALEFTVPPTEFGMTTKKT